MAAGFVWIGWALRTGQADREKARADFVVDSTTKAHHAAEDSLRRLIVAARQAAQDSARALETRLRAQRDSTLVLAVRAANLTRALGLVENAADSLTVYRNLTPVLTAEIGSLEVERGLLVADTVQKRREMGQLEAAVALERMGRAVDSADFRKRVEDYERELAKLRNRGKLNLFGLKIPLPQLQAGYGLRFERPRAFCQDRLGDAAPCKDLPGVRLTKGFQVQVGFQFHL